MLELTGGEYLNIWLVKSIHIYEEYITLTFLDNEKLTCHNEDAEIIKNYLEKNAYRRH